MNQRKHILLISVVMSLGAAAALANTNAPPALTGTFKSVFVTITLQTNFVARVQYMGKVHTPQFRTEDKTLTLYGPKENGKGTEESTWTIVDENTIKSNVKLIGPTLKRVAP